jgi:hypothetical protein
LFKALKAQCSKAQGGGCAAAKTLGQAEKGEKPCKGDAGCCVALTGLDWTLNLLPRVPSHALHAPPPWALLHRAFSAGESQTSYGLVQRTRDNCLIAPVGAQNCFLSRDLRGEICAL